MKSDYSDYLMDPAHLENEESEWARQGFYKKNAGAVRDVLQSRGLKTVVEFGCGSGWVAYELGEKGYSNSYIGIDKNPNCIDLAHTRNQYMTFIEGDVRDLWSFDCDVVCAFAFLKHFSLEEWGSILCHILEYGKFGVFAVAIADHDLDDGTDFPHTSVTLEHLDRAVAAAGHKILKTEHQADSATGYEMLVWTERV